MIVIDANLFLYAYNADAPQQRAASEWLTGLVASRETIALPWVTIWAFIRLSTNSRIWNQPLPAERAFAIVDEWLSLSDVVVIQPGPRHLELLKQLVITHNAGGPLVSDAVLAALAIENGALLASTDQDFSRFKGLQWINPLSQ